MTMFYRELDLRLLEEKRMREIADEQIAKKFPALTLDKVPEGFIRTWSGDLVNVDEAMKGPPIA